MNYEFRKRGDACSRIDDPILFQGCQFTARQLLRALGVFTYHHASLADTSITSWPDSHQELLTKAWTIMGWDASAAVSLMLQAEPESN